MLALGLLLLMAAEVSRLLSVDVSNMSAIWPPLGIAIGASLVVGARGVLVYAGALATWMVWRDYSIGIIVVVLLEQSIQCAMAVFLLRRFLRRTELLDSLNNTLRFYFWGALVALMPASLLTTGMLYQQGLFAEFHFVDVWLVYWLSEALGVMLFAPLAEQLVWSARRGNIVPLPSRRTMVFAALLMGLISLSGLALLNGLAEYGKALTYLYFPLLAWAAMSGQRWLSLVAVPTVALVVLAYVVVSIGLLGQPAGFLLVEAVLVIFMMTLMSQLVQAVSRERAELSLGFQEQSRRDLHTGLLNDRGLLDELGLARAAHPGDTHMVGILSLQNFADALDLLEVEFSRVLECHVAERLAVALDGVPVARVGAGNFAFCWHGVTEATAMTALEQLCRALQGFGFSRGESLYVLSVAVGVVALRPHEPDEVALSAAGQAVRQAARQTDLPLLRCQLDDELITSRQHKLAVLEEIKAALRDNRFLLVGQEIRAADETMGKPYYEVLVRMQGRDGELLSPGYFLPVAQDYGLMGQLDRWVVENVFIWLHQFGDRVDRMGKLAINLSGDVLADPDFPAWVMALMQRYPLPGGLIAFEVTESQRITDWSAARELLMQLRDLGFSISLDDFGTGLATFDYLTSFPFDVLKIDGRFIRTIDSDPTNQAIVSSITQVARAMGLKTVAEYVETDAIAQTVMRLGVDYLQGYGVAKPIPFEEIGRQVLGSEPARA
jgi:EAL domain-containing protein (putative c-di-GMP-specific phosphodiesterase class I)/integral membrane sensor domain MASE1